MLEPNQEAPWPTGLTIREQLIQLPQEDNKKITVTAENLTDHDLTPCGCTTLGWFYGVDAVYPLEMKSMAVQESTETYNAIPWHLYQEVKSNI